MLGDQSKGSQNRPLYTAEQRHRRDSSRWTLVQGILAPVQFVVFLVSLCLVSRYLSTGLGEQAATASIVTKTLCLYAIMITGSIWEREVFGRYLFAPAFFWEDVVSMLVLALHTAYLAALLSGALDAHSLMLLAKLIITDSGGVQEEAATLGIPVLVTRRTCERLEAVEAGVAQVVGPDADAIVQAAERLLGDAAAYRARAVPTDVFGDGRAAERIVTILRGRHA